MDISDRLKSLGVNLGIKREGPPLPASAKTNGEWPIEKVLSGYNFETRLGPVFLSSSDYDLTYSHGQVSLSGWPDTTILAAWGKIPNLTDIDFRQFAFLDTETTGLAGGTGTYAFLVGLGFFTASSFKVIQLFLREPREEEAFILALFELLQPFKAVVTFNGKSFDIPLLKTRAIMKGFNSPFPDIYHLDLLHLARRLWRNRLESRALGDLEREILGFMREESDIPGYLIPQYYFDYLASGDARPLSGIFYHNNVDIVSLAALFNHIGAIVSDPFSITLPSLDIVAIARLYEECGRLEEAVLLYETGLVDGLPEQVFLGAIERFAVLRRKQGRWDLSAQLWEKAASHSYLPAFVELAKYQEHQLRHYDQALDWASKGLNLISNQRMPAYQAKLWENEFIKRINRLKRKYSSASQEER
jgi:uncharacterized protein YprB with RNaseH-like and TPR domain